MCVRFREVWDEFFTGFRVWVVGVRVGGFLGLLENCVCVNGWSWGMARGFAVWYTRFDRVFWVVCYVFTDVRRVYSCAYVEGWSCVFGIE